MVKETIFDFLATKMKCLHFEKAFNVLRITETMKNDPKIVQIAQELTKIRTILQFGKFSIFDNMLPRKRIFRVDAQGLHNFSFQFLNP